MKAQDFLVIGSGIAGLLFALQAAKQGKVTVLSKNSLSEGNTWYAQGGIASVVSPLDSFESHVADTLDAGAGLCHEDIVRLVVEDGPRCIEQLVSLGTTFDREQSSADFELGREGGHSARRILHSGDQTGAEIHRALLKAVSTNPNIELLPYHTAVDLITERHTKGGGSRRTQEVLGAYVFNQQTQKVEALGAKITLLATGGVGRVYLYTSNPDVATGDGIAMAYRAGTRMVNMEFIQFHPTCLYHPVARTFLLTEAMRGEGAKLRNQQGEEFMFAYDERGELAPRDIVARAIDDQMKKTGADYVLLDISHRDSEFIKSRFPMIYAKTLDLGFDLTKGPVPVVPAAHYCCGGVWSDEYGRTDIPRLYVCGETAWTGLHGANRLASNSLLEAVVFAERASRTAMAAAEKLAMPDDIMEWDDFGARKSEEEVIVSHTWDEVRKLMWNLVGIVRSDRRLEFAKRRLQYIKAEINEYYWSVALTNDLLELRNIIDVAEIIVNSAALRRESRGLHYNVDCPERDDGRWKIDSVVTIG